MTKLSIINLIKEWRTYGFEKLGRYYSSYRAFVIDNEDPENLSRLILKIPDVTGNNIHPKWAWPKNCYSGKNYGINIIPEKNTMVWVTFEYGDPSRPLWEHGYYGKEEKPEEFKDLKNFAFKTPGGHLIELDDTKKELRIRTINGKTLVERDGIWYFDGGENQGLVKVEKLTQRLNAIEDKINNIISNLKTHTHTGVTTGPGVSGGPSIIMDDISPTEQSFIENENVKH